MTTTSSRLQQYNEIGNIALEKAQSEIPLLLDSTLEKDRYIRCKEI